MYMFFDTETTGTPRDYNGRITDLDNWPRVIQLAWQLADQEGNLVQERTFLVKPDGWVIPKEKFWIDNGFSTEQNEKEGHEMSELLDVFISDYEQCELLVAHNLKFDHPVLSAEMLRYGKKSSRRIDKFCTMLSTVDYCQLPGSYGFKWPKLQELHKKLFGKEFDDAHDAGADVTATRECFFELKKRGII